MKELNFDNFETYCHSDEYSNVVDENNFCDICQESFPFNGNTTCNDCLDSSADCLDSMSMHDIGYSLR